VSVWLKRNAWGYSVTVTTTSQWELDHILINFYMRDHEAQPPIQWVPGALSPGVKRGRGVTLTTHPHLVPRLRMSRNYTSSPLKHLHGVKWDSFMTDHEQILRKYKFKRQLRYMNVFEMYTKWKNVIQWTHFLVRSVSLLREGNSNFSVEYEQSFLFLANGISSILLTSGLQSRPTFRRTLHLP
jgi:hypothetical protein